MNVNRKTSFQILLDEWRLLNFYGRFEQVVALILSAVIAVIIVVSLIQLIGAVFTLLIMGGFNPIDHKDLPERVWHGHELANRDGVQAFNRSCRAAPG